MWKKQSDFGYMNVINECRIMNTIEYKFKPGEKVFAVNFYPIGARIFEGTISKVHITIRPYHDRLRSLTQFYTIVYELDNIGFRNFAEKNIFATIEEAKEAKQNWLNKIENEKDNFSE